MQKIELGFDSGGDVITCYELILRALWLRFLFGLCLDLPIFPPQVNCNDDKCNQYKDQSEKYPLITYASFWKNRKIKQYEKHEYIHGINV
jgi:hypothetical protein